MTRADEENFFAAIRARDIPLVEKMLREHPSLANARRPGDARLLGLSQHPRPGRQTSPARPSGASAKNSLPVTDSKRTRCTSIFFSTQSPDDDVAGRTLNEMAHGIRWQEPAAADQALSLSGDFECVAPRTDLYFDVPYPFWNNPFRGMFFDPYSLRERDDGNVFFQVDELKDVRDIDAAKKAAADKPLYYENHGWDLHWQRVSDHPDIYIGVSDPTPRDEEGNIYVMKMIVARAADGRFFRIAFNLHAAPESVGRYALLVDEVAKTVTTIAPYGSSRK